MNDPVSIKPRTVTDDDVEHLLRIGIRNRWHALCPSSYITDKPVSLFRMGLKLVLWRDAGGTLHVQDDHCPHRGAPLSLAKHLGDRLACIYHGVQIGTDGTVLCVPGSPGCKLEGQKAVKTYPCREVADGVFAWFGDELHPQPAPFEPPPQLAGEEYERFLCYCEYDTPYRFIVENNMDPMHGTFLHKQSHSMSVGATEAKFRIRRTGEGFFFEKSTQRDVNFDWSEWVDKGMTFVRLEIPYAKNVGPGGNFGIISMSTPIGEKRSAHFFWRFRKVQGWQRDVWKFLYRNRLEARHWHVLEQDRMVAEGAELDASEREYLYDHDVGLVHYRRWMRTEAQKQLSELADAGAPMPWELHNLAK